jgi:hypothetical protein
MSRPIDAELDRALHEALRSIADELRAEYRRILRDLDRLGAVDLSRCRIEDMQVWALDIYEAKQALTRTVYGLLELLGEEVNHDATGD